MKPGPKTPEAIAKVTKNLPTELPAEWSISERGVEAIRVSVAMSNTKHGLFAHVPIMCKGEQCPYADTCILVLRDLHAPGERCPLEIAAIMDRFDKYMRQLGIEEDNAVDLGILKNLVDIEIQIVRADKKIAINGDFIDNVIAAISAHGDAYYKPELGKAADFKLRLISEHCRLLGILHATRKDKAADKLSINIDASNYAAKLLARRAEMQRLEDNTIDVTP